MEEDNDGALKRQRHNGQHQDSEDGPSTTSPKRFKLKTDMAEGSLLPQEPLDSNNNGNDNGDTNEEVPHTQNGDLTLSITNGQGKQNWVLGKICYKVSHRFFLLDLPKIASISSRNQQGTCNMKSPALSIFFNLVFCLFTNFFI